MTREELKRKVEAVYRWVQAHHIDPNPPCPTCSGVKWEFRLEPPGPLVPRVCMTCGHVQLYDAARLGLGPWRPRWSPWSPRPKDRGSERRGPNRGHHLSHR